MDLMADEDADEPMPVAVETTELVSVMEVWADGQVGYSEEYMMTMQDIATASSSSADSVFVAENLVEAAPIADIDLGAMDVNIAHQQGERDEMVQAAASNILPSHGLGPNLCRRIRSATSIRKATRVALQTCFNSRPFPDSLPGIVPLLFKDNNRIVQEHAARAILELTCVDSYHEQIVSYPNLISGLHRLLSKRQGSCRQECAALALGNLGAQMDMQFFVQRIYETPESLSNFVRALVPLLFRDDNVSLQDQACSALTDLSSVLVSHREIGGAPNAIAGIVRLLSKSDMPYTQDCAALTLSNIAVSMGNTERIVRCPNALGALIGLLVDDRRPRLQELATKILGHLAYAPENAVAIGKSPHFPTFLNGLSEILLRDEDHTSGPYVQELAAATFKNLSFTEEINERMGECPMVLRGLVYCLYKDMSFYSSEYAAMALGNLAVCQANKQRIANTPDALPGLMRLLLRFQSPAGQKEAVFAVSNLAYGDDVVKVTIAELPGALEALVTLLSTNEKVRGARESFDILGALESSPLHDSTLQESAVSVLCNLTCVDQNSIKIAEFPGALEGLVSLFIDNPNRVVQEKVAKVLSNLAIEARNKIILAEFPNVLVGLVGSLFANECPGLQEHAAKALRRLADVEVNQVRIVAEFPDVLAGLVHLLSKDDIPAVQGSAAGAVVNLARAKENRVRIADFPGALASLKRVIRNEGCPDLQENAVIALSNLAIDGKNKKLILEFPDMLADFVQLISQPATPRVQELAAGVIARLAETWRIQLKVARYPDADVIALLTKLLNTTDNSKSLVQEFASWAIGNLAVAPENQTRIARCPDTIQILVRLISEKDNNFGLKYQIAWALANLAEEAQNRPLMVGAVEGLVTLLNADYHRDQKGRPSSKRSAAKALTLINLERGRSLELPNGQESGKAYAGRGEALLSLGMYVEALADMNMANQLDPESATTCSFRSFVKTMVGDCEGALPDANKAVDLEPEYPGRWQERGILRRIMGNLEGALEDLNKAIELDPDEEGDYELLKHRGYTKFLLGDQVGAQADAEWAIRVMPEYVSYGRMPCGLYCLPVKFLTYDLL